MKAYSQITIKLQNKVPIPKTLQASLFAISLCMGVIGCQSVDQDILERTTPDIPEQWSSAQKISDNIEDYAALQDEEKLKGLLRDINGVPSGDWVASFNDSTLYALIAEAMTHNNNLQSAASNLAASRSNVTAARAGLFPSLSADGSAGRIAAVGNPLTAAQAGGNFGDFDASQLEDEFGVDRDQDGNLDGLDLDGDGFAETQLPNRRIYINNYRLQANINWELDVWGRVRDEAKAASNDAYASIADLDGAQLSVAAAVTQGWFNLIESRLQRELSERTVTARESNLRITMRRYERGVATSLDVRLSRSQLSSDKAALLSRRQQEKIASRRLEVLLGRYPEAEIAAASKLPSLPKLNGAGAPGDLLARRPDIIAAEARMEAAGLRARAARKQMLPALTITANVNTSGPVLADVIDPERLAGNLFAGIAQPIFQGGRLRASAKRAKAQAEAAIYNYADTVLLAFEEAENALDAEIILAGREEALKLAFEESAAAEDLTQRRYNNGAASIFNLLDAQTRRIVNESLYITAMNQRVSNRVQLYLAIGGDFLTRTSFETASFEQED